MSATEMQLLHPECRTGEKQCRGRTAFKGREIGFMGPEQASSLWEDEDLQSVWMDCTQTCFFDRRQAQSSLLSSFSGYSCHFPY